MKFGKYTVDISNGEKVLFPERNLTKNDIVAYYMALADVMLPHLKNRPLMLQRFPNGIEGSGFYQKEASDYFPDWVATAELKKEGGTVNHVVCNNKATLAYLCNQGTISYHTWLSTAEEPNNPTKFIIDLDPPSDDFAQVREGAFYVKQLLDELELTSFVMTTGSSGVHIVLPLDGKMGFESSREFGKSVGELLIDQHPDLFTFERLKQNRKGRIYFDIQRNAYAQTAVAPYSLRPLASAPVATPIAWKELENKNLHSRSFTLENIGKRLARHGDPWAGFRKRAVSIATVSDKLARMV